jgi:hypothetical protein
MFMIKYFENGNAGPVAVCDVCGKELVADHGNIAWTPTDNPKSGDLFTFVLTCKDQCTRKVDFVCGHQDTIDIDVGLVYLISNTKTDMKRARHIANLLS